MKQLTTKDLDCLIEKATNWIFDGTEAFIGEVIENGKMLYVGVFRNLDLDGQYGSIVFDLPYHKMGTLLDEEWGSHCLGIFDSIDFGFDGILHYPDLGEHYNRLLNVPHTVDESYFD